MKNEGSPAMSKGKTMMRTRIRLPSLLCLCFLTAFWIGCQSAYYSVWEKLGKEKRHLLKDHVKEAQSEQEKASEEFKDVLSRVKTLYGFDGGDLEAFYSKLKRDYESCEDRASNVERRIEQVERIAADLFTEWESEIAAMTNESFRSKSRQSLVSTKKRYKRLRYAMNKAKSRMEPVLRHLRDYVLYLKHNLNAQAVGALKREVGEIEAEVDTLIKDMGISIKEADRFLKSLG
jgi:predicted  nucleic acid-binding Zn-ribbon protein